MRYASLSAALALALVAGSATAGGAYSGKAAAPTDPEAREIAALFDRWNAALASGQPRNVAALYADNGVLLPTVSNEARVGPQAIERYFVDFLKAKPQGTIDFREIRKLDDDTAVDAGVYTFRLTKDGKPTQVQARYTFVYEKQDDGQWKIVNHHSSAMPEAQRAASLASR